MSSSGSTPTATPTPRPSWTATAGWSAQLEVPSSQAGSQRLLGVVTEQAPGRRCWALEGTGCYGAGLASFLADQGEWVVEVDRPKRPRGRTGAKSDPLDAIRAGREALSREHLASPRQRGHREALRVLQLHPVRRGQGRRRRPPAAQGAAGHRSRAAAGGAAGGTWLRQARACAALQADPRRRWRPGDRAGATADRPAGAVRPRRGQGARGRSCGSWSRRPRRCCWPSLASAR